MKNSLFYLVCNLCPQQLLEKSPRCKENNTDIADAPKLYHECMPLGSDEEYEGWCYTRKYLNDSAIMGQWGYCDPNCRGQSENNNKYNLASQDHNDHWTEDIFSLDEGSSGHCHTYNPANDSLAGNLGQFAAFLGTNLIALHAI